MSIAEASPPANPVAARLAAEGARYKIDGETVYLSFKTKTVKRGTKILRAQISLIAWVNRHLRICPLAVECLTTVEREPGQTPAQFRAAVKTAFSAVRAEFPEVRL